MSKNILIIEDEPKILEFITSYVKTANYKPICASNGHDALKSFKSHPIDLVLLDLMLPDITGEKICIQLRQMTDIPIIMITAKSDEESIIRGLEIGADDYITKPFSPRQLIARINALFRRVDQLVTITKIGPFMINDDQYIITLSSHNLDLTSTEFTLFSSLLKRPTKVFTRDELAGKLQNGQYEGYTRSIDSHIKNIRNKIASYTDIDYIKTVRGIGYQFQDIEGGL